MVVTRDGELGRQFKKLQRSATHTQQFITSANSGLQSEDFKLEAPGEQLGLSLDFQIAAVVAVAKTLGVKPPKPFEPNDSQDPNKIAEAEVHALDFKEGNKYKSFENLQRDVLGLQWKLLLSAHSLRMYLSDLLQRKLASYLPAMSTIPERDAPQTQQEWSILQCRCAILKGQHQVTYRSYSGATQLLR
jgi:hypothetical protein